MRRIREEEAPSFGVWWLFSAEQYKNTESEEQEQEHTLTLCFSYAVGGVRSGEGSGWDR